MRPSATIWDRSLHEYGLIHLWVLFLCPAALIQSGCDPSQSATSDGPASARLTVLTKHYAAYMNAHRNQPPPNETEFKHSLAEGNSSILKQTGAATEDELFVSPRDGQPFVINYGTAAVPLVSRGVIAYEKTGKDGQRLVGYRLGYVEAVDEEKFRTVVPKP